MASNRALANAGAELSVACDPDDPIIVVTGSGLWTVEQMTAHLGEYRAALLRKRRDGRGARVLVRLEDTGVQLPAVTEVLTSTLRTCHQPGDRVAMIVPGALARMQMRRLLDGGNHAFFESVRDARAWLAMQVDTKDD